jgi:hypothetical protein
MLDQNTVSSMTRLLRALKRRGIPVRQIVLRARNQRTGNPYSPTHLYNVANGVSEPTRECMDAIVMAAREVTGDSTITVIDLFEFTSAQQRRAS